MHAVGSGMAVWQVACTVQEMQLCSFGCSRATDCIQSPLERSTVYQAYMGGPDDVDMGHALRALGYSGHSCARSISCICNVRLCAMELRGSTTGSSNGVYCNNELYIGSLTAPLRMMSRVAVSHAVECIARPFRHFSISVCASSSPCKRYFSMFFSRGSGSMHSEPGVRGADCKLKLTFLNQLLRALQSGLNLTPPPFHLPMSSTLVQANQVLF
jgi:hypothetical protein